MGITTRSALVLTFLATTAVAVTARADTPISEGTDPSGSPVVPMKVGIVDFAGQYFTQVQARRSPQGPWVPNLRVLVHFPEFAEEDALLIQFKAGKKKIGKEWACKAREILSQYQENQTTPVYSAGLVYFECQLPDSYQQKKAGTFELELSIRQTLLDKKTSIGSLPLKVINIKQGSQNKQTTLQTELHDSLVGSALVYEGAASGLKGVAAAHHRANLDTGTVNSTHLSLLFWSKNNKETASRRYTGACLHNGKKVAAGAGAGAAGTTMATNYWSYEGKKDKAVISWKSHLFTMYPLRIRHKTKRETPNNNSKWHYLDENPGTYECKFMADGAILGAITFEVADGAIVRHRCQDDINAPGNVYVVPFEDKGVSTEKLDKALQRRVINGPNSWSKGCPAGK